MRSNFVSSHTQATKEQRRTRRPEYRKMRRLMAKASRRRNRFAKQ